MTKKKFVQQGDKIFIYSFDDLLAKDTLAPGIYTVAHNMLQGYYLQKTKDKFEVNQKSYGSLESRTNKIINTYKLRTAGTGVLLTGLKGAGKTLLSQKVSNRMIDEGFPVILIEDAYAGEQFINFLNGIGECVLVFDEFAKVFTRNDENDKDSQDSLLGIFDGNKSLKRLIFVIDNNPYQINEFYKNRPGRLFYHFQYSKLEEAVIEEYCKDFKLEESTIVKILSAYYKLKSFSFDILKAVVDEHLRYPDEDILDIVDTLNIENDSGYKIVLVPKRIVKQSNQAEYELHKSNNPYEFNYQDRFNINLLVKEKGKRVSDNEEEALDKNQCTYIGISNYDIAFENKDKVVFDNKVYIVECEKVTKNNFDYSSF